MSISERRDLKNNVTVLLFGTLMSGVIIGMIIGKMLPSNPEIRAETTSTESITLTADRTFTCSVKSSHSGMYATGGGSGYQYKEQEVSPGKCKWVIDEEAMDSMAKEDAHRHDLFTALQRRVLSDDEMKQVLAYGDNLNMTYGVSYSEVEKQRELNEAFLQQWRLRAATVVTNKTIPATSANETH